MKAIDRARTLQVTRPIRLVRPIIYSTSMALILVATAVGAEKVTSNSQSTGKTKVEQENKPKASAPAQDSQEPKRVVTGSYIPQKTKRHGAVAETTSPVYVID